jgi:hypothetical protein
MKTIIAIIFVNFCLYFLNSCGNVAVIKSNEQQNIDSIDPANAKTSIYFEKKEHNFGTLSRGEKVACSFRFRNTGKYNLVIESDSASCGCTSVKYSKKPIKPNEESTIDVVFDSEGFRGSQYKTVKIFSNAEPKKIELLITAVVNVTDEKIETNINK